MRKQSGFTLIELMVVMAIIAILATAGVAAYGGYIKKARDTTRIADLRAIESVILGSLATNGTAVEINTLKSAIEDMNNGQLITDPLYDDINGDAPVCLDASSGAAYCGYLYTICDNGGYILSTTFESESNISFYSNDKLNSNTGLNDPNYYELGNCDVATVGQVSLY